MTNKELRALAIALLDDGNGINEAGWTLLEMHLRRIEANDIYIAVKSCEGRNWLPENHKLKP